MLLGSTGSIGTQAIDVAEHAPDRFRVTAVAAGGGDPSCWPSRPPGTGCGPSASPAPDAADELRAHLDALWPGDAPAPAVHVGPDATIELAGLGCDVVLNAVAGAQGLRATLAALRAGRTVALANKESLVAGGPLVTEAAGPGQLQPGRLRALGAGPVPALGLGGRGAAGCCSPRAAARSAAGRAPSCATSRRSEALAHPTWDMGKLITTNSATLVNKGLEVIEAHLLFDVPYERIDVVVHPQSVIHSMVEFTDGSTIAQASPPDMRLTDRARARLARPRPRRRAAGRLDPGAHLDVRAAGRRRVPGGRAGPPRRRGGWLRAGGVQRGQRGTRRGLPRRPIGFLQIVDTVGAVLDEWLSERHAAVGNPGTVEDVEQAEGWARDRARALAAAAPD